MSSSNNEITEHVHVKLHSPNKKKYNLIGIYRAPSDVVQARFLTEGGKNNQLIFQKIIECFV